MMTLDYAKGAVNWLKLALAKSSDKLSFEFEMHFPDVLFRDVWNAEIPAPGISKRSGVYLILNSDNEVLYIGKATKNNLAAEIYNSKFKKVTSTPPSALITANSQKVLQRQSLKQFAAVEQYAYLVLFVEETEYYFLKTVIPSRKATRDYLKGGV
jgi:hypothetical protein